MAVETSAVAGLGHERSSDEHEHCPRIAVVIPCYNEQTTIAKVIEDFRSALPQATVYVCDNASEDRTAAIAREAGAVVIEERLRGKGHAVRRMFADVEADLYLLVDGDDTYDASVAPDLVARLLSANLDMVNAARSIPDDVSYRRGHRFGSTLLTAILGRIFGGGSEDVLSGYRAFSRRFVKSFPIESSGFEIESELTVHALEMRMPTAEIAAMYTDRPQGSVSKLRTFRDGWRILRTILVLFKEERPLAFFSAIGAALAFTSIALAFPVVVEFARTGLVPRVPTAVLASAIMLLAFLSLVCGLILDTVTRGRREMKRMLYLTIPGPAALGHGEWPASSARRGGGAPHRPGRPPATRDPSIEPPTR